MEQPLNPPDSYWEEELQTIKDDGDDQYHLMKENDDYLEWKERQT